MTKLNCLNPIAACGLDMLTADYVMTDTMEEADAVLVRSAVMHDMELPDHLLAIARAGAGVNNIPLEKCAEKGIVVFNTPGANANGVKEIEGMRMLQNPQRRQRRHLPERRSKGKNWASLAWEPSAYWWQMRQTALAWMCMDVIHTCQWSMP